MAINFAVCCCPFNLASNHITPFRHVTCNFASICAVTNLGASWVYMVTILNSYQKDLLIVKRHIVKGVAILV